MTTRTWQSCLFAFLFFVCLMLWQVQVPGPVLAAPACAERSMELVEEYGKALIREIILRDRNGSISIEVAGVLQNSRGKSQLRYLTPRSICEDLRLLNLPVPEFTAFLAQEQQTRQKKAAVQLRDGAQKQVSGQEKQADRFEWQQRLFQKEERLAAERKLIKVQERMLQKERQRLKKEWEAVEKAKQWVAAQQKGQAVVSVGLRSDDTQVPSRTSEDSSPGFILVLLLLGGGGAWYLWPRKMARGKTDSLAEKQNAQEEPEELEEVENESDDVSVSDPILAGGVDAWNSTAVVQAEALTNPSSHRKSAQATDSACILIVEDSRVEHKALERILTKLNYTAEVASSGTAALVALAQTSYAAVLMDCQLPEMDGLEITTRIRQQERLTDSYVPIIAVTARTEEGARELCLAAGMDDYVPKPVHAEVLTEVLMRWIPDRSER